MDKKVTIKDIAKAANVSTATVSYIINNRSDQVISEETRNKVLQIINLFNYKPSIIAKNLRSTPEIISVAFYTEFSSSLSKLECINVLNNLVSSFSANNLNLIYAAGNEVRINNADAIVAYNISKDSFYKLGKDNFIPLVALDTVISDPLFFEINNDFSRLSELAKEYFKSDFSLVMIKPNSTELEENIRKSLQNCHFLKNFDELSLIKDRNILCVDCTIRDYFLTQKANVFFDENLFSKKCNTLIKCIINALSREKFDDHFFKI